jgi:uncharacterized protein (DUF433 family)
MDEHGAIRVGDSRITLDIIVEDFEAGASADEIAQAYDTLERADVYAVVAYYLHHKEEFLPYFKRREEEASEIERQLVEAGMTWPDAGKILRARVHSRIIWFLNGLRRTEGSSFRAIGRHLSERPTLGSGLICGCLAR